MYGQDVNVSNIKVMCIRCEMLKVCLQCEKNTQHCKIGIMSFKSENVAVTFNSSWAYLSGPNHAK